MTILVQKVEITYDEENRADYISIHCGPHGNQIFVGVVEDGEVEAIEYREEDRDGDEDYVEAIVRFPESLHHRILDDLGFDVVR